jgi:hypothetical protein
MADHNGSTDVSTTPLLGVLDTNHHVYHVSYSKMTADRTLCPPDPHLLVDWPRQGRGRPVPASPSSPPPAPPQSSPAPASWCAPWRRPAQSKRRPCNPEILSTPIKKGLCHEIVVFKNFTLRKAAGFRIYAEAPPSTVPSLTASKIFLTAKEK